ncbi:hypothetical protein [Plantactinospora sp. DSM 117369]
MARRDWDSADRLLEQLDQVGWSGQSQVISAAAALAVDRRFRGKDLQDIAAFVRDTRACSAQVAILGTLLQEADLTEPQLEQFTQQVEKTAAEYM